MFQFICSFCSDEHDTIVTNPARFLEVNFSLQSSLSESHGGEETVADSKQTKTQRNKNPNTQVHHPRSSELQDCLFKCTVEENCVICKEGTTDVNEKLSPHDRAHENDQWKDDQYKIIAGIKDEIERKTKFPKALKTSRITIE